MRALPPPPKGARVFEMMRLAKPVLAANMDDAALVAAARDEEHLAILRALAPRSGIFLPMRARGHSIGMVWLFTCDGRERFGPSDVGFAEDLVARAALALDNARLYEQAQRAVHLRDDFLLIASHELKTPLTALKLQLASMRGVARTGAPDGLLARKLDKAERQVDRLTKLVNELLDVSQIAGDRLHLVPEPMDLAETTREITAAMAAEFARSGSALHLRADGAVTGTWDRFRVEQAIINLLANAIKYGEGKPIELEVHRQDSLARLVVKDHGIGIDAEAQRRIFDKFERAVSIRHFGGLGLGLWIVREFLEASGGTIRVESAPREGSTFIVELPCDRS
jgi:signal transduction histidine kinase